MTAARHLEVAGGGYAGLTLAIAAAQRGWSVRVHERDAEPRATGAGIFLWSNGLRVLHALGADRGLDGRTHQAPCWEERDAAGSLLSSRTLPPGTRMVTMTRRDLHAALLGRARESGVEIRLDSRVVAAEPGGTLVTADGRRWPADVVVGADGINSAVRDSLGLPTRRERYDDAVYRLLVPLRLAPGTGGQWRNYVQYWDHARSRRVLYVPCNQDELYLSLGADRRDPAVREPFDHAEWCGSFPPLRPLLDRPAAGVRPVGYESVLARAWTRGHAAILGDAAHAMPPTLGQGAGTAMVNALALALRLDTADDVPACLRSWEQAERPETDATQRASVDQLAHLFPDSGQDRSAWDANALAAARREAGDGTRDQ